jgi:PAS domain S-box-containing protein
MARDHFEEAAPPVSTVSPILFGGYPQALWIYDDRRLLRFQKSEWIPAPLPPGLAAGGIRGGGASRDGGVWIAGADRIEKFRDGKWSNHLLAPVGFQFTAPVKLLEDSENNLWAGDSIAGLLLFRRNGRALRFTRADGLSSLAIRALFEDREKNVWVGTHGGGMIRLRPKAIHLFDDSAGLNELVLDTVAQRQGGGLLVATYGGGFVPFDEIRLRFGSPMAFPGIEKPVQNSFAYAALEDRTGTLWLGIGGLGLLRITPAGATRTPFSESREFPRALFEDSNGIVWFGSSSGITSYRSGQFTPHKLKTERTAGPIAAIAEDGQSGIWAGGQEGLFRIQSGQLEKFPLADTHDYGPIVSMYGGATGLWIGLERGGLRRIRNSTLTNYGPGTGLPQARMTAIAEDNHRRLWMATFQDGLLSVPIDSFDAVDAGRASKLDLTWLRKEDGLGTNQFRSGYQPAAWKGKDGRLWFTTLKGLVMVDPRLVHRNPTLPTPLIEAVSVNGQEMAIAGDRSHAAALPAGSRSLQFFYTAPSFAAPEKIRFQYQLEGLESNWVETAERSIRFDGIKPGQYVFRVKAANDSGLWNPVPTVFPVRISYFLWEHWWFQSLALALIAGISAITVYGLQRKKLLHRTQQLHIEQKLRYDVEQLQSVLRVSEERFAKAFNASPSPLSIATFDEGRFVDVNASFLQATGLGREAVVGSTYSDLEIWDGTCMLDRLRSALDGGGNARGLRAEMRDRSGRLHHLLVSAEAIELGGKRHLLAVSDDVTEREQLEQQLSQAQKMESIGRLAGGVAHDFNNLLTVINGYSDLILRRAETSGETLRQLQQIRKAGERAKELTQQLLAFSRKQMIVPQPVNLNLVVTETEGMLRHLLPATIEMVTKLDPGLGLARTDPGQVHQVLLNLALNARDAMPAGGRLILETANVTVDEGSCAGHSEASPGPSILLAVTDTGAGMDESVRRHIFEPFFTTKALGTGTGLGLATVYGIVRQHDGWIWVYSEPQKGTSFQIYFPRLDAPAAPHEDPETRTAQNLHGTETILLVEDRDDVRAFARRVLEGHGYRVLEAPDGAAALAIASGHGAPMHILVTDVVMPGMTGPELRERLNAELGPIRVLYTSGYTGNAINHQTGLQAATAFLQKPFTPDGLLAKVREILDSST